MLVILCAVLTLSANASATDYYSYILPMIYDDIEIGDKYIYYCKDGRWGRADPGGSILTGPVYDSLEEARVQPPAARQVYFPFKGDNGLYGYKNSAGAVVIPAQYDAVANNFENNAAIVQKNGKYGIVNSSGEVLFDFISDTLYKSDINNYYAYTVDGRTGFIDNKFKKLSEPFLRATFVSMYDGYAVYQASGDKYGLASYDGKILCGAIWDYMRDFCEGLAAVGVNEDFYGINARWGYIDKKGNTVIPVIFNSVNPASLDFSGGLAGVCEGSSGYYIDKEGRVVIRLPENTYPYTGFSRGLAVISENLDKSYINRNGQVIIEAAPGVRWYRADAIRDDIAVVSSYLDSFTEGYAGVIRYHGNNPSSWAQSEVSAAEKAGLLPEELAGQYTVPITRAEYCRLSIKLIESYTGLAITDIVGKVNRNVFTDTADLNVLYAEALGIVEGRGGGIFDPRGKINRQEAAKILVNTYKSCAYIPAHVKPMPVWSDKGLIDSWAEEGIWYMNEWGVMIGVGNNRFAPKNDYTREMSVMTMIRLYNLLLDNRPET
ncbi:MAG: WG repeat-containing protein, partial [Eubacteriales bacterium]|nr:WG repeat-containing protein [Eubacteriales bacterium]